MRLLLVGFYLLSGWLVYGQTDLASKSEFPIELREGLLWVSVRVPESERPLNFLLDTGAEASVIDLRTARELNLRLGQRVEVAGVHVSTDGYWCRTRSASANGVDLPNRLLALDLGKLSSSCERRVDGLIGADFFRDKVVQLDFQLGRVRLLDPDTQLRDAIPLEVRRCGMRAKASINGKPGWFRVDTGCASPVQWVTGTIKPQTCTTKVAVGLAQVGIPQGRTTVKIGSATLTNVETGLHSSAIFKGEAGLLGNGLFARFKSVTLDAIRGKLFLSE